MSRKEKEPGKKRINDSTRKHSSGRSRTGFSQADMDALHQLDRLLELRRRQERLAARVPPGVVTRKTQDENGTVLFHFSHETLGELGHLKVIPVPPYMFPVGGCLITVEIFPDDPEVDPQWEEKYRLLCLLVDVSTVGLPPEMALHTPMAEASVAREQRRLYLRCLECRHTRELRTLVARLTFGQYDLLVKALRTTCTPSSRSDSDERGIQQRLTEVQLLWEQRHARK